MNDDKFIAKKCIYDECEMEQMLTAIHLIVLISDAILWLEIKINLHIDLTLGGVFSFVNKSK